MSNTSSPPRRVLSPHLQIYTPMLTMMMSIAHRITGAGLYLGFGLFVVWLALLAMPSADCFNHVNGLLRTWPGLVVLVGFSWSFFHHFMGGLRHAVWDMGTGMGPKGREGLAHLTLWGGFILTALFWAIIFLCAHNPQG